MDNAENTPAEPVQTVPARQLWMVGRVALKPKEPRSLEISADRVGRAAMKRARREMKRRETWPEGNI